MSPQNPPPQFPTDPFDPENELEVVLAPIHRRRRVRQLAVRSLLAVVSLALIVGAGTTVWGLRRLSEITYVDVPGIEPAVEGTANNWLLIGTDGRDGIEPGDPNASAFLGEQVVGKRTDTIMLVRVDAAARSIDLLSIPRDLWVQIDGRDDYGRINGAYNGEDGRRRLVATLSNALDVKINHYAEVDFVGFQQIVDALEGVPLWFPYPTRDVESGLHIAERGCHILDGSQALAFARARSFQQLIDGQWQFDPTGDIGRTARQRTFLARTIDTATDKFAVSELGTVNEVLVVGGRNLIVEDGASALDLLSLARTFTSVGGERVVGHSLPVENYETTGGAQVLRLAEVQAQPVLEVFRTGIAPAAPEPATDPAAGSSDDPGTEVEPTDSEPVEVEPVEVEPVEVEPVEVVIVDDPDGGYGRFGFADSDNPAATPCV